MYQEEWASVMDWPRKFTDMWLVFKNCTMSKYVCMYNTLRETCTTCSKLNTI